MFVDQAEDTPATLYAHNQIARDITKENVIV